MIVHAQTGDNQTTNPKNIVTSVVACSVVFVVLFVAQLLCLQLAFVLRLVFFASRARRLRSASLLPEATRTGFLAITGFVCFGASEVTRSGVAAGKTVSSGTVSSVCAAIMYI